MSVPAKHHHNEKKIKTLTIVSNNILKHQSGFNFHIEFKTKRGKIYMLLYSIKNTGREESHIYEVHSRGFFLDGDKIPWSSVEIDGIENFKLTADDRDKLREIEIIHSNFFNKLLDEYINRE